MRGRKKTPAKVLQLRGNPGKRPVNQEPQFEMGIPDSSLFFLNEMAKKYWDYYAPKLHEQGILTVVDGGILAAYCSALARLYYSEKDIEKHGAYQTGEFGIKKHPAVLIAKESRDQIRALGSELGLTAASRARIKATPKDKDKSQGARRFLA